MWVALAKATGFDKLKWENQNKEQQKQALTQRPNNNKTRSARETQDRETANEFLNVDDNAKCKEKQNKSTNIIAQIFRGWPI